MSYALNLCDCKIEKYIYILHFKYVLRKLIFFSLCLVHKNIFNNPVLFLYAIYKYLLNIKNYNF